MLLSFVCGISPFKSVGGPGNRLWETTFTGVANTVVLLVVFSTAYVLRVINQRSLVTHFFHSKITHFGEHVQILTSFVALAFTLILCFLKRNKLRKLFHVLNKIDKQIIHLGANLNYKGLSRLVMLALFGALLIYILFLCATFVLMRSLENQPDFFEWVFFFLPVAIKMTLKLQFYCTMQLIKYRLHYINLMLNKLQENLVGQPTLEFGGMDKMRIYKCCGIECDMLKTTSGMALKRDKYDIIADLCRTHDEICDACYLAEEYFSHQMLTTVTIEFVCSLFNLYFIFEVAYNNTIIAEVDKIEFICYFAYYTVVALGTVYALLNFAESVTAEVSIFQTISWKEGIIYVVLFQNELCSIFVHKLLNALGHHENRAREVLTRFSMQLLHRKIKFTACGLFALDNTLIFTVNINVSFPGS